MTRDDPTHELENALRADLTPPEETAAFVAFARQIADAAPRPAPAFQRRLANRIQAELASSPQRNWPIYHFPARLSLRIAPLVLLVLLLATGVVLAVSLLVQQVIRTDPGLQSVYDAGKGLPLNLSQTIDGYTVTLEWVYADGNRLTVAYTIAGQPGVEYTNLETQSITLKTRDGQTEFPQEYGAGNVMGTPSRNPSQIPTGNVSANQMTFDTSQANLNQSVLNLRLELVVEFVTVLKRTAMPIPTLAPRSGFFETPSRPFVFDFSVPLNVSQRVLNATQTVTDQGIALTLEKVTVAPSQTTVSVCFAAPDSTRQWTSIPHLTANGTEVAGGGTQLMQSGESRHCDEFSYNVDLYNDHGDWQLEITELVGFGSRGNDQQRIKGSWLFHFKVP